VTWWPATIIDSGTEKWVDLFWGANTDATVGKREQRLQKMDVVMNGGQQLFLCTGIYNAAAQDL
jgi:hypothetical protein